MSEQQHKIIALGYLLETLGQIGRTLEAFGYEAEAEKLHKIKREIDSTLPQQIQKQASSSSR